MSHVPASHCDFHYGDAAIHQRVAIHENVRIARDTYRFRFASPEIARRIVPGQFLMVRLVGADDPLLARPFALYDTVLSDSGAPWGIDVVYLVVGKMTGRLARLGPGQPLEVWGPLGNGFASRPAEWLVMVAGGIGQTPFLALAREALGKRTYGQPQRGAAPVPHVTLCYGARSCEYFAGLSDFESLGVQVRLSTDDGSAGHVGVVTDQLRSVLSESPACRVVCCGPERMMEAVAYITAEKGIACEVSLESPMACGIGICFSCVAKVRDTDAGWDYHRTCVEGPVFDAQRIVW